MDAKKFGEFIATIRKESNMTQMDLAKKLQVTDKAVSKWERGLGFPDINTIEPLANALGISVLEVMQSERIVEAEIPPATADAALTDMFELVKQQRKNERKRVVVIFGVIAVALFGVLLVDSMTWLGFLGVCIPIVCFAASIALFGYSIWRKKNQLPCLQTVVAAIILLFISMFPTLLLILAAISGIGPTPN